MSKLISRKLWSLGCLGTTCAFILLLLPILVNAGPYTDSAHGNSGYGVLRSSTSNIAVGSGTVYTRGNCVHCHEQHASIDGVEPEPSSPVGPSNFLLFSNAIPDAPAPQNTYSETETACLACHGGTQNESVIVNNNFSVTFGGAATAGVDTILKALNQLSYHNLNDISVLVSGNVAFNVPSGATPCSACHNPHLAKANSDPLNIGDPTFTALSRPTDHLNLYGDDTSERMPNSTDSPTEYYQPPNRVGGGLEPDGGLIAAEQAAKTPNYNTFCIDCHNQDNDTIWSEALGRNLKTFDWSLEQHGGGVAHDGIKTEMLSPFIDSNLGEYTLSCLDCHEPHGSSNIYLIRTTVNGGSVSLQTTDHEWDNLCQRCHVASDSNALQNIHHEYKEILLPRCLACHFSSNPTTIRATAPPKVRDCSTCHYHGAATQAYKTF